MRVLEAPPKAMPGRMDIAAQLRAHGFAAMLAACVLAYGALLLFHPGARRDTPYPAPVGDVLHDANFPGGLGAEDRAREIHAAASSCLGVTATHFRAVGMSRCAALLTKWGKAVPAAGEAARCRYHYASLADARQGRRVSFVTAGADCALP